MQYVYIGWLCQALSWPSRTNYSNGSGGAIPSPKLAIQQPFYACLCLTMPILRYDWNSGFHTPASHLFVRRVNMYVLSTAVRWPEQNARELTNCSYYICKKPKSWQYCLAKKVLCLTKVPSSQLFCPETLSKQFTLVGTKCLLNSQRVLAEALFPEKLCSSQTRFTTSTLCHY